VEQGQGQTSASVTETKRRLKHSRRKRRAFPVRLGPFQIPVAEHVTALLFLRLGIRFQLHLPPLQQLLTDSSRRAAWAGMVVREINESESF
ncbi:MULTISPECIES: hypothetical protein, partial [unclassified Cupriavidus]|uniref:hypothetical protein n=1 Tax=unclassified Cupriavidus TaxID=2640874 RepID=UPI00257F3958